MPTTPKRGYSYPAQGTKPYFDEIEDTFLDIDSDVDDVANQASTVYDTIGTSSAPGELRLGGEGAEGSIAHAKGFWSANDGGGGLFSWVVDATPPSDNGGTIIIPQGVTTGYWQRLFDGKHYDVRWFGARGDGTTDDTTYLQLTADAIAALTSKEGTILLHGEHLITSTVNCGFASVIGSGAYAKIKNNDADSYLSLNNAAGGGVDARYAELRNIEIEMTASATIGIKIARNRIYSRGLRIIGANATPGSGSQKGIFFDCTSTAQAFHDFDEFRVTKCYDAVHIGDTGETNTYFFNSNRIGTKQCYITTFTHGIYLRAGFTACTQNTFGGYFEIQTPTGGDVTVHVYFDAAYTGNRFDMHRDGAGIDYLIYNTGDAGASGNLYYLNDSADYTTTGPGSSNSDVIINSEDVLTVVRNNEYIVKSLDETGWIGFSAASPAHDVVMDLVGKAFTGTPTSWRQLGSVGFKKRQKFIVYDDFKTDIQLWVSRTNTVARRATQYKLNQDYSLDPYEDFFVIFDLTTATRIATLPNTGDATGRSSDLDGFSYKIKNLSNSSYNLTVQVFNSPTESIEGAASIVLTPGTAYEFALDGTIWYYF